MNVERKNGKEEQKTEREKEIEEEEVEVEAERQQLHHANRIKCEERSRTMNDSVV